MTSMLNLRLCQHEITATFTATASKAVFSTGKLETTAEFCPSAVPCTPPPNFIGNFLEIFFFFLGHYSADRGTSRDVSEVNIELVSAMLRWQKGVDGAECLCLQRACICLPEPNLAQFAHTEMKSRHISPPPLPPRRSICFYKWPQTSVARVRAALTDGDGRATCGHVRPRFFFFGVAAGGVLRDVLLRDALTFPLLLKGQLAFG